MVIVAGERTPRLKAPAVVVNRPPLMLTFPVPA